MKMARPEPRWEWLILPSAAATQADAQVMGSFRNRGSVFSYFVFYVAGHRKRKGYALGKVATGTMWDDFGGRRYEGRPGREVRESVNVIVAQQGHPKSTFRACGRRYFKTKEEAKDVLLRQLEAEKAARLLGATK